MPDPDTDDAGFDPGYILEVLDRHGVTFVIVGGVAALAHNAARPTRDIDVVPERSRENLDRLSNAMLELGARLRVDDDPEAEELVVPIDHILLERMQVSNWRTRYGDLDVLADIPAMAGSRRGFDDLLPDAEPLNVGGRVVIVASLDHVIESKQYANRPKDQSALPELEALRERRGGR